MPADEVGLRGMFVVEHAAALRQLRSFGCVAAYELKI